MTGRAKLNRRMRWVFVPYCILLALIAIMVVSTWIANQGVTKVLVLGIVVAFIAVAVAQFMAVRCPTCRGNLAFVYAQSAKAKLSQKFRYCPYCSVNFDDEISQ